MNLEGQIIVNNLERFNTLIRDEFVKKGINDTKQASNSLKVIDNGNVFLSVGSDYIEVLDRGRGAGKYAPVDSIQNWVKSKLGIIDDKEIKQIAFLINRKIKNEGTAIFKDNTKGLEIDEKIETLRKQLASELQVFAIADAKKQLNKFLLSREL